MTRHIAGELLRIPKEKPKPPPPHPCRAVRHVARILPGTLPAMRLLKLLLATAVVGQGVPVARQTQPAKLIPVARVAFEPLEEMSGIAQSSRSKDVYWTHNDGGDSARIFAIKLDGSVVSPASGDYQGIAIDGAKNVDWEDITRDGKTLYVDDLGNNNNARRDLCVYAIREPDPASDLGAKLLKRIPVAYPDQKEFPGNEWLYDCEAIFVFRHKLYLLTKQRSAAAPHMPLDGTALYRLDSMNPDKTNVPKRVDSKDQLGGWVTGAAMSPNGKTLAVLCQYPQQSVWLFETPKTGDRFLSAPSRRIQFTGAQQCEGIGFVDNDHVVINNEQRELFTLAIR